jgi:hypothetical protein
VVLGDPGSGKSTFVNFVGMCLAGEALENPRVNLSLLTAPLPPDEGDEQGKAERLLPVRVVLRDFVVRGLPKPDELATAEHLWRFIETELGSISLSGISGPICGVSCSTKGACSYSMVWTGSPRPISGGIR